MDGDSLKEAIMKKLSFFVILAAILSTTLCRAESNEVHVIIANQTMALIKEIGSLPKDAKKEKESKAQELLKIGRIIIPVLQDQKKNIKDETIIEILTNYDNVMCDDVKRAKKGLEYFHGKKAFDFVALGLENKNMDVQIFSVNLLKEYSPLEAIPYLIEALNKNNFIMSGSENATIHQILKRKLVEIATDMIIGEATNSKNKEKKDEYRIVSSSEIQDTINKAKDYLKEKKEHEKQKKESNK